MPRKNARKTSRGEKKHVGQTDISSSLSYTRRPVETQALPDYSYIKDDLKRIGIISGSMFAAMIALYFILPFISPLYAR